MSKFRGIFDRPPVEADDAPAEGPPPSPAPVGPLPNSSPAPTVIATPPVEPRRTGRPTGKRTAAEFTQVTAYVRKATHHAVKVRLLTEAGGREFSDLVEVLLAEWLTRPAESPRTQKSGDLPG